MFRNVSNCNTYNYSDASYWDARYIQESGSFDWYQRYFALRPFLRNFIPTSSPVLMVGCGNAGNFTFSYQNSSFLQLLIIIITSRVCHYKKYDLSLNYCLPFYQIENFLI